MSMQSNPGNIKMYGVKLENKATGGSLDITPQIKNLSIFESMYDPTIYCEILMEDGIDLWNNFPILGEETVKISFKTPGVDDITIYNFNVFKMRDKSDLPNSRMSVYILECVSSETVMAIKRGKINICSEDPVERIVPQILKSLGCDKLIFIEKTKGVVPVTIPNLYSFQAISFLRERAVSADVPQSSFVFFENQYGFNFRTIESLIKSQRFDIGSREFTYDNSNVSPDKDVRTNSFRNIITLKKLSMADSIKNVGGGAYNSSVESFDMITKSVDKKELNFSKSASQFTSSDKLASPLNSQSFMADLNKENKKPTTFFTAKDSSLTTNLLPDAIGGKIAFSSLFSSIELDILVYGDSDLTVGETLNIKTKNVKGTTERNSDEAKISGVYLITHLRHIISPGPGEASHYVAMKIRKMGYSV